MFYNASIQNRKICTIPYPECLQLGSTYSLSLSFEATIDFFGMFGTIALERTSCQAGADSATSTPILSNMWAGITWEQEEMKTWRNDVLMKFLHHPDLALSKHKPDALYDAFTKTSVLGPGMAVP
ncbi:hypothetical protein GLOIN_2v1620056 [Rhizophagus irregularis DAOM 181602=DAOM 197198]|nr:hypothetical protein GLOIN_2v1620056 [Rhizophagus irregularis DAOM 181602=DAOM 197198]